MIVYSTLLYFALVTRAAELRLIRAGKALAAGLRPACATLDYIKIA